MSDHSNNTTASFDFICWDIETNGLLDTVDKFHTGVIGVYSHASNTVIYTNYYTASLFVQDLLSYARQGYHLVGHNIIRYDIPVLKKLCENALYPEFISISDDDWKIVESYCVDTLAVAWHILAERAENNQSFSLEAFGEFFGVAKIEINDWNTLSYEEYTERCKVDVEITILLWEKLFARGRILYPELDSFQRYLKYLNFKMRCILRQEEQKIKLDWGLVTKTLEDINIELEHKKNSLEQVMPDIPVFGVTKLPTKVLNTGKQGLSSHAEKYAMAVLQKRAKVDPRDKSLKYVKEYKPANSSSHTQMKSYLHSLGWVPDTYKVNDKGQLIPQISNENREVSESIKALYNKEPRLNNLEGMYMLSHRKGVLEGFIANTDPQTNLIEASIRGLTSTLRFKHRNIVNLPGVNKPYGKEIRGSLIVKKPNNIFIGCDMVALEDVTKQHYMAFFDREYVNTMRDPDYDPHLDLAVRAGFLTEEQATQHKNKEVNYSEERQKAKRANYACTYGAGVAKLSESIGITREEAAKLHKAYWERNWSIQKAVEGFVTKTLPDTSMWIFNPVSRFWYPLRSEKDKLSAVNQSTGVYVFDLFLIQLSKKGFYPVLQYHDEILIEGFKWEESRIKEALIQSIQEVNEILKLNVEIKIDYSVGKNYAEVH